MDFSAQAATSAHKTTPTRDCVDVPRALVRQILQHPGLFYVNVHTTTYPDGAISGMPKKATKR